MLLAILSGFIVALVLFVTGGFLKGKLAPMLAALPLMLFLYFLSFLPGVSNGNSYLYKQTWITSLNINLNFKMDGLALLFALMITGIGALVYLYAASYLKGHKYLDRFYVYLSMFMASMLGVVLSDNLMLMFIFWELTSISSFFLIGFNNDEQASRKSALIALAITGGGGFLMMAGFILMGEVAGTFSINEMLLNPGVFKEHSLYGLILILVFAGAFTKSAQFPFHFWLPGAMKAPTPVSAYLHSATMVKAGIFLLARLTPLLGGHAWWNYTLMAVGGVTMLHSAFHSLFRTDLKGILAYSTIAALGMLVFLLGIGTEYALMAAGTFILVHALYKAALFLITGVIDHETGTRDITKLSGLAKVMWPLALAGLLAAFSNAGIPFTFGFIGKDLIYEATLHNQGIWLYVLTGAALLTNIWLLYAGFSAGIRPFAGALPQRYARVHLPSWLMWGPPLLLAVLGVVFGIFPALAYNGILQSAVSDIAGININQPLKIWHGFNTVLALSAATIVLGLLLYFIKKPRAASLEKVSRYDTVAPQHFFELLSTGIKKLAFWYTRLMHNGYLRVYIMVIVGFLTVLVGYQFFTSVPMQLNTDRLSEIRLYEVVIFGIMVVAIFKAIFTRSRLTAIISMSIIGYAICLIFVFYGAPDLAMTQFTIDTLTVVLFVLVLFKLPSFMKMSNRLVQTRDAVVAISFGVLISLIALQAFNQSVNKEISHFYGENAYRLAKGKNVVNVILVDFRGFDTMVEIIVLTIAALGVYSLLKLNVKSTEKE